jgi:hypothetical protein
LATATAWARAGIEKKFRDAPTKKSAAASLKRFGGTKENNIVFCTYFAKDPFAFDVIVTPLLKKGKMAIRKNLRHCGRYIQYVLEKCEGREGTPYNCGRHDVLKPKPA